MKSQCEINRDCFLFLFLNCESCRATSVESLNKNTELDMSIIGSLSDSRKR